MMRRVLLVAVFLLASIYVFCATGRLGVVLFLQWCCEVTPW